MSSSVVNKSSPRDPVDLVVVDDDSLTLEIVSWNLRKASISHELFIDSEQAMQYLCTAIPKVLIVDFFMPMTNGVEFLNTLIERKDLSSCKIYLCSAITPRQAHLQQLRHIGASVIDKDQLCDRSAILKIMGCLPDVTDKRPSDAAQIGLPVAGITNHEPG